MTSVSAELLRRRQLGGMLRRHREHAGLSGEALGHQLGHSQSWVSKVERGAITISPADYATWVEVTAPEDDHVGSLKELFERTQAGYDPWHARTTAAGGGPAIQAEIAAIEATCTRLAEFQPALVPGLLQTAAYAMDVVFAPGGPVAEGMTPEDAAGIVQRRMERQSVLWMATGSGKTANFVMLAAALHTRVAGEAAMRGQLAHLAALCEGGPPGVTIGIIPQEARVPITPTSGFALFDHDLVVLEGPDGGEWQVTDPVVVTNYDRLLELALGAAVTGSEAAALCRRAMAEA